MMPVVVMVERLMEEHVRDGHEVEAEEPEATGERGQVSTLRCQGHPSTSRSRFRGSLLDLPKPSKTNPITIVVAI
jgi:hypothetical protein